MVSGLRMTGRTDLSRMDRIVRATVYAAVAVSLAVGGALVVWKPELERWIANNVSEIGGPFELVDQDGQPFTRADLLGHPHVIYFGFTYCPDLCPTTLFLLASVVDSLGDDAAPLKVVFVSVDPQRDTVAVMKQYVTAFHDDFIGLTGSPKAIAAAAKAYRIYYERVDLEGGDYTMDHTASAMLFNADGTYADSIAYNETEAGAREKIARLLAANVGK
jgi:protein SCO1/2